MIYDFFKFKNILPCYRIKGSTTINYLSIFDISSILVQNYFHNAYIYYNASLVESLLSVRVLVLI